MARWERLQQLPSVYLQQLHEMYDGDTLPMEVRHYLAAWIEKQEWDRAAQDDSLAMYLFQVLLEKLDNQYSRFVQDESFLMQHNIRRHKQNFQTYQEAPRTLARNIMWFLNKEIEILESADLAQQVQLLHVEQNPMEMDRQHDLECKMAGLGNKVQCMEHTLICLEEQQDEFDFKHKTLNMEVVVDEAVKKEHTKVLQNLVNRLDNSRKVMLSALTKLLEAAQELQEVLVQKELVDWQRRQQRACIGAPDNVCLDQLEKWFTCLAVCLFQVRTFLCKLEELMVKVTYEQDPIRIQKPALQKMVDTLLTDLLKSSIVVETQPSMPQGKGYLVLRTNVQFSVKTRFLVKFPEMNHLMKVTVSMDGEAPQVKGYRRFNVLGTNSKSFNMAESQSGGMVADFRHLTLKEQKSGGGKGVHDISLSVTEELHVINFYTVFELSGLSVKLQTSSLPAVIISNSSQQQSAWASVLWFNMLCQDPKDILFFASCPMATWEQLREMLSWQFLSATNRGLDDTQLDMIALKLFGPQEKYEACQLSWSKFSKENSPEVSFTFWVWFDGILTLVKTYLENLWRDGSIMGFVSKAKEKTLLKRKQRGTFLLRFSESQRDGGITFSWIEYTSAGKPYVKSVRPFTKVDMSQIPFHEIIRNFQMMEADNVPENPLRYLYPNTPKDEAFGKYYTEKSGDDSPYIKYIKTKLVFVSNENKVDAKSPMCSGMAEGEGLDSVSGLCGEAAGLDEEANPMEPLGAYPDPMLSFTAAPLPEDNLFQFLNDSNNFDCGDFQGDNELPELCLQLDPQFPMLLQPCGTSYQ